MVTKTKARPQIHMDDKIVEDAELERLLEERQALKESVSSYRKADQAAKDKIRSMETQTPYRVGRFIISKQAVPAKSVAFETTEGSRFTIKTIDGT